MSPVERLGRADVDILELERGQIAGHTSKLLVLERDKDAPTVTLARLRARLAARVGRVPRARQRLEPTPLGLGPPVWVDDAAFDVDRHLHRAPTKGTVGEARLRELVGQAIAGRLPRDRP